MAIIKSMTGHALVQGQSVAGILEIAIKSVNSRFVEITATLGEGVPQLEYECNQVLKEVLHRGKIEYSVTLLPDSHNTNSLMLNELLVRELLQHLKHLESIVDNELDANTSTNLQKLNMLELLQYPNVLRAAPVDQERFKNEIVELMRSAVAKFDEQRQREGAQLRKVLLERLDQISQQLDLVQNQLQNLVMQERERMQRRVDSLRVNLDHDRFEMEVALLAQKADIAEEYDRLRCHVHTARSILNTEPNSDQSTANSQPIGKRLDFLMQEFVREATTLGNKASNLNLTHIAVELKVLIEQMREQVQNIE